MSYGLAAVNMFMFKCVSGACNPSAPATSLLSNVCCVVSSAARAAGDSAQSRSQAFPATSCCTRGVVPRLSRPPVHAHCRPGGIPDEHKPDIGRYLPRVVSTLLACPAAPPPPTARFETADVFILHIRVRSMRVSPVRKWPTSAWTCGRRKAA